MNSENSNLLTSQSIPYTNAADYISDQLARLDILIKLAVLNSDSVVDAGYVINIDSLFPLLEPYQKAEDELLEEQLVQVTSYINKRIELSQNENIFIPFAHLADCFFMKPLELDILIICLAPCIDIKYQKLYAFIQGNSILKFPTRWLIYKLLEKEFSSPGQVNDFLSPSNTLVYWNLLEIKENSNGDGGNDLTAPVIPDQGIRDYLTGSVFTGDFLKVFGEIITSGPEPEDIILEEQLKRRILHLISSGTDSTIPYLFTFSGPGTKCKLETAFVLTRKRSVTLLYVELKHFLSSPEDFESRIKKVIREARLLNLALFIDGCSVLDAPENQKYKDLILHFLHAAGIICFIAGESRISFNAMGMQEPFVNLPFSYPDYKLRLKIWKRHLGDDDPLVSRLAANFVLTEDEIIQAVKLAHRRTQVEGEAEQQLFAACRAQRHHNLTDMAVKVEYPFTIKDIVLPGDTLNLLKEITYFYKYKDSLFNDWGFKKKMPYGQGITALFSGASGTGKTMAASIIANELGLDMYRVDLATVVSKYIGETEKNLKRIFDEARASNVILFFDEADAVFGKRTEVKDAHDRYANIETSYLLQMMEEYDGMTVLATNFRDNIDEAFTRRLRFVVEFPFPDEVHREKIWSISFPGSAPVGEDMDYSFLARKVKMTGGNIKSIALMAGMFAIQAKESIGMKHLIRGIKREYQRHGKSFIKADFMPYYNLIEKDGSV